ncbi:DNA-deoxyinosine glycosylase [Xanthomonas theicola]|uniref:DNA-deoxyinosine glycosylase n=2 Tax=Xanthomonas theicola TaxID=56464 RepID=A0A2S6ZHV5_9XANT|nr:DNA-deoxyinosine glycosylase [Xanthomonas theicola]PPT91868.1 DNA-deoxyinosine glycosylase [Xanthomonas theicola]QNH23878.1 DNA-deoxyinosine glycosylase [Xanthomonas theicola]
MTTDAVSRGLPAQIRDDCRVLILGSMPGALSLQLARYYAHPRNRLWPLLGGLCGFDPQLDYHARLQAAHACGVGLWDVIGQCRRSGSLDTAIVRGSEVPNPLPARIAQLSQLRAIACNGAAAANAFARFVQPQLAPREPPPAVLALPSTSPANAAFSLARLQQAWAPLQVWLTPAPT